MTNLQQIQQLVGAYFWDMLPPVCLEVPSGCGFTNSSFQSGMTNSNQYLYRGCFLQQSFQSETLQCWQLQAQVVFFHQGICMRISKHKFLVETTMEKRKTCSIIQKSFYTRMRWFVPRDNDGNTFTE